MRQRPGLVSLFLLIWVQVEHVFLFVAMFCLFVCLFVFVLFLLRQGLTVYPWLSWNSPRSACLCLLGAGTKGMLCFFFFKIGFYSVAQADLNLATTFLSAGLRHHALLDLCLVCIYTGSCAMAHFQELVCYFYNVGHAFQLKTVKQSCTC